MQVICYIPCRWTENRKGGGTDSGESDTRNLEAESTRSGAERCVWLKTVTEVRCDIIVSESLSCQFPWHGMVSPKAHNCN